MRPEIIPVRSQAFGFTRDDMKAACILYVSDILIRNSYYQRIENADRLHPFGLGGRKIAVLEGEAANR
ncbi:MAG TPA: hypothetical protein G4N94_02245 [Caldilineae bacterium]|nr:hypothetical protein [Caldilineae bacterium]